MNIEETIEWLNETETCHTLKWGFVKVHFHAQWIGMQGRDPVPSLKRGAEAVMRTVGIGVTVKLTSISTENPDSNEEWVN